MGILTNDGHGRGGHKKISHKWVVPKNFSHKWVVAKIESRMEVVTLNLLLR